MIRNTAPDRRQAASSGGAARLLRRSGPGLSFRTAAEDSTVRRYPELRARARADLMARARGGIVLYTAVWTIVVVSVQLWETHLVATLLNAAILVTIAVLRGRNRRRFHRFPDREQQEYRWLVRLVLLGALHWGVLSAWIADGRLLEELRYPFIIILPAVAIGGTVVLAIDTTLRTYYPILVMAPPLVAALFVGEGEYDMLLILAIGALVYTAVASHTAASDYWKALYNEGVAREQSELLELRSVTDPLTGLYNRLYFNRRYAESWAEGAQKGRRLAVLVVDLDHFKRVNDTHGHLAGDQCLSAVAEVLTACLRDSSDTVARYGGEEFVVVLSDVDEREAHAVAERIVGGVASLRITFDGMRIPLTCSVGVATAVPKPPPEGPEILLAHADRALYDAKSAGRNQVVSLTTDVG